MRWMFLVLCLVPATAWAAGDLREAQGFLDRMKFDQAREIAERVLVSPDSGPEDLVRAYQIMGLCLSARGRLDDALMAFRKLLAIDPGFELPQIVSPKLASPFYQAVPMARGRKPITLSHVRPGAPKADEMMAGFELKVSLEADPLGMVAAVRFRFRIESGQELRLERAVEGPGELSFRLPSGLKVLRVTYYFEAVNSHGGVLVRAGSESSQFELRPTLEMGEIEEVAEAEEVQEQPPVERWEEEPEADLVQEAKPAGIDSVWVHTALWSGVGLIGLAGVATWQAKEAGDQYSRSYGEDTEAGRKSQAWAGVMYSGFIVGTALVATGVVLWLLPPADGRPDEEPGTAFGLVPLDRGAVVTFGERW